MPKFWGAKARTRRHAKWLAFKVLAQLSWGLFLLCSLMALLSYHRADNSWYQYSSTSMIAKNWLGGLGANLAATYFYWWGWLAYLLPLLLGVLLYFSFYPKANWRGHWERVLGGCGGLITADRK